jgi:hypothetical protein
MLGLNVMQTKTIITSVSTDIDGVVECQDGVSRLHAVCEEATLTASVVDDDICLSVLKKARHDTPDTPDVRGNAFVKARADIIQRCNPRISQTMAQNCKSSGHICKSLSHSLLFHIQGRGRTQ